MIDIVEALRRRAETRRAIHGELEPVAIDLERAAHEIVRLRRLLEDSAKACNAHDELVAALRDIANTELDLSGNLGLALSKAIRRANAALEKVQP